MVKLVRTSPIRWLLVVALIGLSAVLTSTAASSGRASASSKPYFVGVTGFFTGPIGAQFLQSLEGFEAYIDHVNATGGVNGRQIKVDVLDDQGDPTTAELDYRTFVGDGAIAIFADTLSQAFSPLFPAAAQNKIPTFVFSLFGPTATPYVYGVDMQTAASVELEAAFLHNTLANGTPQKLALITNGDVTATPQLTELQKYDAKVNWSIVSQQVLPIGSVAFGPQAAAIAQTDPTAIIMALDSVSGPAAQSALQAVGVNVPIVNWFVCSQADVQAFRNTNFYCYEDFADPNNKAIAKDPGIVSLMSDMKAAHYKLTAPAGSDISGDYLVADILVAALKKCGDNCTSQKLNTDIQSPASAVNPGGLAVSVGYTKTNHNMVHKVQFYRWNSQTNGLITVGAPVAVPTT